jgi:hypothetical protein
MTAQAPHNELFFDPSDKLAERNFLQWHSARHNTYDQIQASKSGAKTALPHLEFNGHLDADWMHRHMVRHMTHRRLGGTVGLNHIVGLGDMWKNEEQAAIWQRIHAIDHMNIDAAYGLA